MAAAALRAVEAEADPPGAPGHGNGGRGSGDPGERLARLETNMAHLATKADLLSLKSDMLRWQIGILITVIIACVAASVMATISLLT